MKKSLKTNERSQQKRAAIYCRVSSDEQVRGYSLSTQQDQITEVIEKDSLSLDSKNVFVDDGYTGTTDNRPALQKMIEQAKKKQIDVIYVWKIDRLYRNTKLILGLVDELLKYDVSVKSILEPHCDNSDPRSRYVFTMLAAGAEMEHATIKERTQGGKVRAMKDGKWAGIAPYGYDVDAETKKLIINEHEARWVRKFFQWFVNERMTLHRLQVRINASSIPSKLDNLAEKKTKHGRRYQQKTRNDKFFWAKRTIDRILTREMYAGTHVFRQYDSRSKAMTESNMRPQSEWIPVSVPAIVSREIFDAAQKLLKRNKRDSPRRTSRVYLFGKKLECGFCHRRLQSDYARPKIRKDGTRKEDYNYYIGSWHCGGYTNKRCEHCVRYNENNLREPIWNSIVKLLSSPELVINLILEGRSQKEGTSNLGELIVSYEKREVGFKMREERLLNLHLSGELDLEIYRKKKAEIKEQRQEFDNEKRRIENLAINEAEKRNRVVSAKAIYRKLRERLATATYEQQANIIKVLVENIVLNDQEAEIEVNLPLKEVVPQFVARIEASDKSPEVLCDNQRMD